MAGKSKTTYDHTIFQAWARGVGVVSIAQIFERPESEIEAIIELGMEKRGPLTRLDPEPYVRSHVIQMEALVEELAGAASKLEDGPKVRAMCARGEIQTYLFRLHQELGFLPNSRVLAQYFDARVATERIMDVLESHGVSGEALYDIEVDFESALGLMEPPHLEDRDDVPPLRHGANG